MSEILPYDHKARQTALDPTQSFCVSAPAGSGKTELLTQRFLQLLCICSEPQNILAFTFTRKAATQMRTRILHALFKAKDFLSAHGSNYQSALEQVEDHKKKTLILAISVLDRNEKLGWELMSNSARLRINTIDSFNAWLTSRLPFAAGFGARPKLEADLSTLYSETIQDLLEEMEQKTMASSNTEAKIQRENRVENGLAETLCNLVRHANIELPVILDLLIKELKRREQWLQFILQLPTDENELRYVLESKLQDIINQELTALRTKLQPLAPSIGELVSFAITTEHKNKDSLLALAKLQRLPLAHFSELEHWHTLRNFFLTKENDFRKTPDKNLGFPAGELSKTHKEKYIWCIEAMKAEKMLSCWQIINFLPDPNYDNSQWKALHGLLSLLPRLAALLRIKMLSLGKIDHSECALGALMALGSEDEPTDLGLALDYQIEHILIDEFQDTSSIQFNLLKLLTSGWTPGDGKTLFIVGDGMQSCYGFRNADVSIFLGAKQRVGELPMTALQLEMNFRSSSNMIDWINKVFTRSFPTTDDIARGGVRYQKSVAGKSEISAGVHCQLYLGKDSRKANQLEAIEICNRIKQIKNLHPSDSIAILVRARSHLNFIVPALREAGISWNADEIDTLSSYTVIEDINTLLRSLLFPSDTTAWFALLHAPFIGVNLQDIEVLAIAMKINEFTCFQALQNEDITKQLSTDAQIRIARALPVLLQASLLRKRLPLVDVVERCWLQLGGASVLRDSALLDNIASFLTLVDQESRHDDLADFSKFNDLLKRSFGSVQSSDASLRILTIHKAKGLEFDHILLPALNRPQRNSEQPLLLWNNHMLALRAPRHNKGRDSQYQYLSEMYKQREVYETNRLLYVAITRAKSSAYLYASVSENKDGELKGNGRSLISSILPTLDKQRETLNVNITSIDRLVLAEMPSCPSREGERIHSSFSQKEIFLPLSSQKSVTELTHNSVSATIGELVHLELELRLKQKRQLPNEGTIPAFWHAKLRNVCPNKQEYNHAIEQVRAQLKKCVESNSIGWLFIPQIDDRSELALYKVGSDERVDYRIDRTFIKENERWIIDYKASTPSPGQSIKDFCHSETIRYKDQLLRYSRAMAQLDPRPQRIALLFTQIGHLHEITLTR